MQGGPWQGCARLCESGRGGTGRGGGVERGGRPGEAAVASADRCGRETHVISQLVEFFVDDEGLRNQATCPPTPPCRISVWPLPSRSPLALPAPPAPRPPPPPLRYLQVHKRAAGEWWGRFERMRD
ncbi:Protein of unknown function, partial [Gryllus bimaculatus]